MLRVFAPHIEVGIVLVRKRTLQNPLELARGVPFVLRLSTCFTSLRRLDNLTGILLVEVLNQAVFGEQAFAQLQAPTA